MDSYNRLLKEAGSRFWPGEAAVNTALSGWDKNELKTYAEKDGNRILHHSCSNGWYDVSIRLIEEFGLDPNVQDQCGNTALHWACGSHKNILYCRASGYGNVELVTKLISSYKCNPLLPNKAGNTPLHCAIKARDSQKVHLLIKSCEHGSLPSTISEGVMSTVWEHGDGDIFMCLINEGWCGLSISSLSTKKKNGDTILHECAYWNNLIIFKYLVTNHNCKPDIENNEGETPLHIICSSLVKQGYSDNRCEILFYLLMDVKVSPHIKFSDSDISVLSVVCKAITNGNHDPSILLYLIFDCGCDPSNDSDLILYILCNAICLYEFKYIDILYQLVVVMKIGPYVTLENGRKFCIMCCPTPDYYAKLFYKVRQMDILNCNICRSRHYYVYSRMRQNKFLSHICNYKFLNFEIPLIIALIKLFYYFILNVKCECHFHSQLIECVKKIYSHITSLPVLHQIITTFGFLKVDQISGDNLIDANTLNEAIQKSDKSAYKVCFQNPLYSARIIISCLKPYSSSIYSLFYDLINSSELDLMSKADIFGNTLLHLACLFYYGDSTLIEYLLSTGKTDPLCINEYQQTPLTLLALSSKHTNNELNIQELVAKFGELKVSHPIESYVNIIVLGDPGVGKSTLVNVTCYRHDAKLFRQFRSVTGVELCTAGIVPHVLNDKDMGRIIVHDLAGQVEYYSSHTAVIGNLLQASAAVFVIVVSLADERSTESLGFWLSIVENASSKTSKQYHVFVVVSHYDTNVADKTARLSSLRNALLKQKISDIICHTNIFCLDCRKLGGGQLNSLMSSLSDACESVRSDNVREMSLYCHMLYDFLNSHGKSVYSLNGLVEAIKARNNNFLPTETSQLFSIIQSLSSTGLIMYLGGIDNPVDKVWIIADKSVLLKNLNGVLFAPKHFKEHVDQLVSKTGMVKLCELSNHCSRLKYSYDPDMIVQFLESMELSHEISKDFILSSNLAPSESVMNERYLFIPALIINSDRPDNTDQFQFGWCLQCSDVHSFFLSLFIHLIILHLLKYTETRSPDDPIDRRCHIWNNGIYWKTRGGVSVLVELFEKNKRLVLLMSSCEPDYTRNMTSLRKTVIEEILTCKNVILLKTAVKEFVINNLDLRYPEILQKMSKSTLFSLHEFQKCYVDGKEMVLAEDDVTLKKISVLLNGSNIKEQCESIFAGRFTQQSVCNPIQLSIEGSPTDTTVYSVLLKYRPQLLGIIGDPDMLAVELVAKGLLSPNTQDDVSTFRGTRFEKASMIIDEIVRYFKQHDNDCERFLKFCQVLKDHGQPGLDELAEEMEQLVS